MSLSDRLKNVREQLGETQKSMSRRFDLGENTWAGYERAGKVPKGETLQALAELGYSLDWIVTGQGSMQLSGEQPQRADFDRELFKDCMMAVEELLEEMGKKKAPREKVIELVFDVYDLEVQERSEGRSGASGAQIIRLVQRVA